MPRSKAGSGNSERKRRTTPKSSAPKSKSSRKPAEPLAHGDPERPVGQVVLDDLLGFAPSSSLAMAADILDPEGSASNYAEWIQKNLPEAFSLPFGPHHQHICDEFQMKPRGLRLGVAAPRSSGKSTLSNIGLPLAAIAMGSHRFIVLISSTQTEAEKRLLAIRNTLERNDGLVNRWPRLRYINKPRSRKHKVDTAREIQLAGGWIVVVGAEAKIRGIVRDVPDGSLIRPDLLVVDDIDQEEQARSKVRTDRLVDWLFASVAGLGAARWPLSIILIGTTISADAMVTRMLKGQDQFKNWKRKSFPAETVDKGGNRKPMWPQGLPVPHLVKLTNPDAEEYIGRSVYAREYLLDPQDVVGAMWSERLIAEARWDETKQLPHMKRIVVAVDPSWGVKGDECGIVVVGRGADDRAYVLDDRSILGPPMAWGKRAAEAFKEFGADRIIAEIAFGAETVKMVMQTVAPTLPFSTVRASRGKVQRFEPVTVLYEQNKVSHVRYFKQLEDQQLSWTTESHTSPDRIDALCWGISYLMLGAAAGRASISVADGQIPMSGPRRTVELGERVPTSIRHRGSVW